LKQRGIEMPRRRPDGVRRNNLGGIGRRQPDAWTGFRDLLPRKIWCIGGFAGVNNRVGGSQDRDVRGGSAEAGGHAEEHGQQPGCAPEGHL
jgi:hypothetical protein